jgi:hypothetical protein
MTSNDNRWRKSSYSGGEGGNCVEVGNDARRVLIRDSQNRGGQVLNVSAEAWRRFARELKNR